MKRTFSSSTLLLVVMIVSFAIFLPALQSGVGGGGQSNVGGGGGGTPGGANTQVQFNNSGAFGGSPNFTYNSGTVTLFLGQVSIATGTLSLATANGGTATMNGLGATNAANFTGPIEYPSALTTTNCSSSASPAVCGSAAAGSVVVAAAATTEVVNSTAVTANSQIQLTFDSSLGTKLAVTCNTTVVQPTVSARTGGTSFTITVPTAPTTNPACFSYSILN